MRSVACIVLLLGSVSGVVYADEDTDALVSEAMKGAVRTDQEVARDANRKPVETLRFFGLRDDMRVLELLPGGGWYTKILAPVLAENGKLYVGLGSGRVEENLLDRSGFEKVSALSLDVDFERDGPFRTVNVGPMDFGVDDLDMVLTFRNMHNFTPPGRENINRAVFASLKSGGVYGVVDHTARHMAPMTAESRRRADPVQIIQELVALGFSFEGYSDLHYRPDDELRYEVGRHSVKGNTDRFTLLFRKP